MKIQELEYYDDEYQWQLEPVKFLPDLNLLVGVSGAGKTRILQAINSLKSIANGKSLNGVKWNIHFSTKNNDLYQWSGQFETKEDLSLISINLDDEENEDKKNKVKIKYEHLQRNEDTIVERKNNEIIFNGEKTPKLSPFESVIKLLNQEDSIIPIKKELDKIVLFDSLFDSVYALNGGIFRLPESVLNKYEKLSLLELKESNLPLLVKLAILYKIFPNEFNEIKQKYIDIFNNVSEIKIENFIEALKIENMPIKLSKIFQEEIIARIKEKGLNKWININIISSGMLKTLFYICELYLSPDGSVILIDEFENSLGINCIDSVTDLIKQTQNTQFIITSHHPYIINNISPAYWKIVTRKQGIVTVKNPEDFHIPPTRQKAFIDLINILENDNNELEG